MGVFVKIQVVHIYYISRKQFCFVLFLKQIIKHKELRKDFRIWQKAKVAKALSSFLSCLILWRKQEVTQFLPNLGQGGETGPNHKQDSQGGARNVLESDGRLPGGEPMS